MAIRMTPSQARSKLRQLENKRRQAVNKYNQDVRRYNQQVKQAFNKHNQNVRTYNSKVRQNRQRLRTALSNLQRAPVITTYSVVRQSALTLNESYVSLESHVQFDEADPRHRVMLELPQQETANSLAVTGALLGAEPEDIDAGHDFQDTRITSELATISADLHNRWMGALFALNPQNPDATRHFCASSREIFAKIFEIKAPDQSVVEALPGLNPLPQTNTPP